MASYARRSNWIIPVLAAAVATSTSWAGITPSGDLSPTNPSNWTNSTQAYIGNTANGTLLVNDGSLLLSDSGFLGHSGGVVGLVTVDGIGSKWTLHANLFVGYTGTGTLNITDGGQVNSVMNGGECSYLGCQTGARGMVNVDGPGSTWTVTSCLLVGAYGTGTLNITNGGQVTVTNGPTYVAAHSTGTGSINFGANGGTLTTPSLGAVPAQITGTGTIITRGLVSDGSLVFDATHGLRQTLTWINSSQNVTVHVDLTSESPDLGAGYQDAGTLTIRDGVTVKSGYGYLGYRNGSTGIATVSGAGSTWTTREGFLVGYSGTGTLNITNGGRVNSDGLPDYSRVRLGNDAGAMGIVNVDGPGSMWTMSNYLNVGYSGTGILHITNGGTVTSPEVSVNTLSLIVLSVGDNSVLTPYELVNNGMIRLQAAPAVAAGSYTPMTATRWYGSGTITALGGQWNNTTHVVTVAPAAGASAGTPVGIDTSVQQRLTFTDAATTKSVWLGFPGTITSSHLTVAGAMLTLTESTALQQQLTDPSALQAGWNFTTSGYTPGDPVALSIEIGPNFSPDALTIYHYDGSSWTPFAAPDLSYDGTYANFTVTSFSAYAIAAPVPEPLTLSLLWLSN